MTYSNRFIACAVIVAAAGVSLSADRVRLRSGKVVEGMFIGGDSKTVRVLLDNGSVSEIRARGRGSGGVFGAKACTIADATRRQRQRQARPRRRSP